MPVQIPVDITIVTLRYKGQEQPQRWTDAYAKSILEAASATWNDRADIEFKLASSERAVEEMPTGMLGDTVDGSGYHFLAHQHPAGNGARVLLVDKVSLRDLGGEAREKIRICLVAYGSDKDPVARMLAHELGHLLSLNHIDDPKLRGPGQEKLVAQWLVNLMYSGALNPAAEVNDRQVKAARSSDLAKRFGGR